MNLLIEKYRQLLDLVLKLLLCNLRKIVLSLIGFFYLTFDILKLIMLCVLDFFFETIYIFFLNFWKSII